VGMPAGLAAWLLVPAAPVAWWIHTVAEQCSRTLVLHTPGGPWWALAWAAMLGTMILASMGVLWWQVIPVLIACAMLLVRIGAWQLGPYETAAQAPSWGSDLGAESHWTVAVCGGGHGASDRSEEHTSELQSRFDLVCRLLLEKNSSNGINETDDR